MSLFSSTRRQAPDAPKPSLRERLAAATGRRAAKAALPAPAPAAPPAPSSPFDDPATVAWFTGGGLVPFPAAAPRSFVRAETAIRLEAGLLLERARAEFARQYEAKTFASDDLLYRKHLPGRLERALRIPELEAAAREPLRTEGVDTCDADDADLVDMVAEAVRLRAQGEALLARTGLTGEADEQPDYQRVEAAHEALLSLIPGRPAEGLAGLRAKARAFVDLDDRMHTRFDTLCDLGASLADDLLRLRPAAVLGEPDPIYAAIAESRRLLAALTAARLLPHDGGEPPAEMNDAMDALFAHRDDTLLGTVPQTAAGCLALASYAVEFTRSEGVPLSHEEGSADLLELMADCPEGPDALLNGAFKSGSDPVHAVIAESRRLFALNEAEDGDALPGTPGDAAQSAAFRAAWRHWHEVALKTKPTTAAGCGALARHTLDIGARYSGEVNEYADALRRIADALAFTVARDEEA